MVGRGERHLLGAERLHRVEALAAALEQDADQVDDDVGVAHRGLHRAGVAHVGLHRMDLADPAERLQVAGEVGPPHRDADAVVPARQRPHQMAAEEARAAEDRDQRVVVGLQGHGALAGARVPAASGPGRGFIAEYALFSPLYRPPAGAKIGADFRKKAQSQRTELRSEMPAQSTMVPAAAGSEARWNFLDDTYWIVPTPTSAGRDPGQHRHAHAGPGCRPDRLAHHRRRRGLCVRRSADQCRQRLGAQHAGRFDHADRPGQLQLHAGQPDERYHDRRRNHAADQRRLVLRDADDLGDRLRQPLALGNHGAGDRGR